MKIRHGFVSNSSSASFIIKKNAYESIFDLALNMIEIRDRDWATWGHTEDIELKTKIINAVNEPIDFISFPTTNYDTFIGKFKNYYAVSTCNNHWDFFDELKGIVKDEERNEFLTKELGFQEHDKDDFELHFSQKYYFWYPMFNVIGREMGYQERQKVKKKDICTNDKHYNDFIVEKDTGIILCQACLEERAKKI